LYANAARYKHSAPIRQAANRNARALADLFILKAAYFFSYGKRALLVLTGITDAALNADGIPQGAAPVLITDIGPGENGIYISAMPIGDYKTISTKHLLHEGLNILHAAVPEQP
jgi:hypothetical protein